MAQSDKDYDRMETDQSGTKRWFSQYRLHRIGGPAVEYSDGTNVWYSNGFLHRIDGPAIDHSDGTKTWFLNECHMEFQDWKQEVRKYYDNQEDYLLMLLKLD